MDSWYWPESSGAPRFSWKENRAGRRRRTRTGRGEVAGSWFRERGRDLQGSFRPERSLPSIGGEGRRRIGGLQGHFRCFCHQSSQSDPGAEKACERKPVSNKTISVTPRIAPTGTDHETKPMGRGHRQKAPQTKVMREAPKGNPTNAASFSGSDAFLRSLATRIDVPMAPKPPAKKPIPASPIAATGATAPRAMLPNPVMTPHTPTRAESAVSRSRAESAVSRSLHLSGVSAVPLFSSLSRNTRSDLVIVESTSQSAVMAVNES